MMVRLPFATLFTAFALTLLGQPAFAALTVQATIGPNPVRPGEMLRVTLHVANAGGLAESNVELRAQIPLGVNNVFLRQTTGNAVCAAGAFNNCSPGSEIVWDLGTLPAGGTATVAFWTAVNSGISAPANGTALTVNATVFAGGLLDDSDSRAAVVDSNKALNLAIDATNDTLRPGDRQTYLVTYSNVSAGSLAGTTLSVPLPAAASFVSASDGGVLVGNNVQWSPGTLAAGEAGQVQFTAEFSAALGSGTLARLGGAQVAAAGGALANQSHVTRIESAPALAVGVTVSPDPVRPGESLRTRLTVTNRSNAPLGNVNLEARIPDQQQAVFLSQTMGDPICKSGGTSNCTSNTTIIWPLGTLPAGATATVSFWSTLSSGISGPADGDQVVVLARASAGNGAQSSASGTAAVRSTAALRLAIDVSEDAAEPGGTLTYNLTYANAGSEPISNATLRAPLPPGTALLSASDGGQLVDGQLEWSAGTLAPGAAGRVQLRVALDIALEPGTVLQLSGAQLRGTRSSDGSLRAARASAVTAIELSPALAVGVTVSPDPVRRGETLRTQLSVTNRSGAVVNDVQLEARIPLKQFAVFLYQTKGLPLCKSGGGSNCTAGTTIFWNLGSLQPGATATVSFWSRVNTSANAPADGDLVTVTGRASAGNDAQAWASDTAAVNAAKALMLAIDVDRDPARPGDTLVYDFSWGNRSASSIADSTLRVPLPAGTTPQWISDNGSQVGNAIEWPLGSLSPGESGRVQLGLALNATQPAGTLLRLNGARLLGNAPDGPRSARANAMTRVEHSPALLVGVEVSPDPVRTGEMLRSRLSVTNPGGVALTDVRLEARSPDKNFNVFLSQVQGPAACASGGTSNCAASSTILFDLGTLQPGATASVAFWSAVSTSGTQVPVDGDLIVVTGRASASNGAQAAASATAAVRSLPGPMLRIDAPAALVEPGEVHTYNLNFGNRGSNPLTDAQLALRLPEQATLVGASGGTVTDGVLRWDLGELPPGTGGRRQVTLQVNSGVAAGELLRLATAYLSSQGSSAPERASATLLSRVELATPLRLSLNASPNPRLPNETAVISYTVHNIGTGTLHDTRLVARIPSEAQAAFLDSQSTGGAVCLAGGSVCASGTAIVWEPGTLAAGESVTVTWDSALAASGSPVATEGSLVPYEAIVTDGEGRYAARSDTVLVAPFTDADGDGIADVFDNCLFFANPDQRDTRYNGYGNRCDADFSDTGFVNFSDLGFFRSVFGSTNPDADFNGDGVINFADLAIFRQLFGTPPGPSALVE